MPEETKNEETLQIFKKGLSKNLLITIIAIILSNLILFLSLNNEIKKIKEIKENSGDNTTINKEKESKEKEEEIYYKLGEFVMNLANKEINRYLKVDITLKLIGNKELEKIIKKKEAIFRDKIIEIISNYNVNTLISKDGKNHLKEEILKSLNKIDAMIKVESIYFNTFIMQ